jgi:L-fuculose-phosphate aldolase
VDSTQPLRASIVQYGKALLDKGLVAGTWGNISARLPGADGIAVTPSGQDYRQLTADDIVIVSADSSFIAGNGKPSSELPMHMAIYHARPDVKAIIHTHSVFASACAVARRNIPPIIEDLVQVIGGAVDVAGYALPGTKELGDNVVTALGEKNGVLLANHGVVGCGRSLSEAMTACELIEKAASIYIYAASIGGSQVLSDSDVATMHAFYVKHYRRQED